MIQHLISFLLFSSLLYATSCLAGMGISAFPYPGPGAAIAITNSCSTGVTDAYNNHILSSGSAVTIDSATNQVKGQSFQLSASGSVYSLVFHTATSTGSPTLVTCRIGPGQNLSSTYYAEASAAFSNGSNEVFFQDTAHILNLGTAYYWGCSLNTGSATIYYATNTIATGQYRYGTAWDMASTVAERDLSYAIKVCQP